MLLNISATSFTTCIRIVGSHILTYETANPSVRLILSLSITSIHNHGLKSKLQLVIIRMNFHQKLMCKKVLFRSQTN